MSDNTAKNTEALLWDELADARTVMVKSTDNAEHMQPMAPQVDPENKTIWFYTHKTTDLAKSAIAGTDAMVCLVGTSRDFHACLRGKLNVMKNDDIVNKYWSPLVAAWFENGKDDPNLTMLSFKPSDAAVWNSTDSAIKFGWEIAKANLTDEQPDVGYHTVLEIDGGKAH